MKIDRPLWYAGTLLSPQQFQQQARWEAWTNESLAHLSFIHPWGVQAVAFDAEALRLYNQLTLILQPTGKCLRWNENHSQRIPG